MCNSDLWLCLFPFRDHLDSSQSRPNRLLILLFPRTAPSIASANPRIALRSPSSILPIPIPASTSVPSLPTSPPRPTSRRETPRAACNASSLADPSSPSIARNNSLSFGWAVNAARTAGDVAIFIFKCHDDRPPHSSTPQPQPQPSTFFRTALAP
jgi:hypothetical protein